jgi:hypothetical protein
MNTNLKIGYDYHNLDNYSQLVNINYDGLEVNEISNIYTLKALKNVIDYYSMLLKDLESELLSTKGKIVIFINNKFKVSKLNFTNVSESLQQQIKEQIK